MSPERNNLNWAPSYFRTTVFDYRIIIKFSVIEIKDLRTYVCLYEYLNMSLERTFKEKILTKFQIFLNNFMIPVLHHYVLVV